MARLVRGENLIKNKLESWMEKCFYLQLDCRYADKRKLSIVEATRRAIGDSHDLLEEHTIQQNFKCGISSKSEMNNKISKK